MVSGTATPTSYGSIGNCEQSATDRASNRTTDRAALFHTRKGHPVPLGASSGHIVSAVRTVECEVQPMHGEGWERDALTSPPEGPRRNTRCRTAGFHFQGRQEGWSNDDTFDHLSEPVHSIKSPGSPPTHAH